MKLSQLIERQSDITSNPRFKQWFGDSKVVDSNGYPQIVYHGTNQDFDTFKNMVWASIRPELPSEYAAMRAYSSNGGESIIPLYMRVVNPFNADWLPRTITISDIFNAMLEQSGISLDNVPNHIRSTIQANWDLVERGRYKEESGPNYDRHAFWNEVTSMFGRNAADAIESSFILLGFDGVQMIEGGELSYGAFNANQVKSVFNIGSFSDSGNMSESY